MNLESIVKVVRGIVKVKGATDGTKIGNNGDRLLVDSKVASGNKRDWLFDVSLSLHSNLTPVIIAGNVETVGTAFVAVWEAATTITFPSAAQTLNIASSSANDTNSAGTGARKVLISGLNGSYVGVSETVNLNGTTNVATSNSYLRVNSMTVTDVGSGGTNAGRISATQSTSSILVAAIVAGDSVLHSSWYTIPAGKTGIVLGGAIQSSKNTNDLNGRLIVRSSAGVRIRALNLELSNGGFGRKGLLGYLVPEKYDLYIQVNAPIGNADFSTQVDMVLRDN